MCKSIGGVCAASEHERLKAIDSWWNEQEFIGLQKVDATAYLILKNCRAPGCQSTVARWVDGPMPTTEPRAATHTQREIDAWARRMIRQLDAEVRS